MQEPEATLTTSSSTESITESRPTTPDSQMTNSLHRANSTIDELTATLAKVSRAPSPDPADRNLLRCCCGREDCANTTAWTSYQGKLESRLILCAEVGQALLRKHEAYVRRHGLDEQDLQSDDDDDDLSRPKTPTIHSARSEYDVNVQLAELKKHNAMLEKRLATALVNTEVSESSKKSLLQELEEARGALSKLTVNQAKSTGWEARLNAVSQERDDLRQELDSERQRAKNAETHAATLKDRCIKLQSEMGRLYDEIDQQKQSRTELSEEILRDARARLEMVQQQQFGRSILSENPEVTQVMESLVADNEALKRDVAELQNLLTESREELRTLQEEVEETRALPGAMRRVSSSGRPGHNHTHSWASSFGQRPISPVPRTGARSAQPYEPLTPNTEARPLSPAVSRATSERRFPISMPRPEYPVSSLDVEDRNSRIRSPELTGRKSPRRPLFLLSNEKAVQTDAVNWNTLLAPVFRIQTDDGSSSTPPVDGRSESSSLAETYAHGSTIAAVVDRTNTLFSRMTQADARTLMNRLKRQRLAGDVSHLSHATVSSILSEANGLRAHFRGVLEDDRAISTCTRRDLRALLNLFREMFSELGEMRVALNDIILDPSSAPKFSEAALDPSQQLKVGGRGAKQGPGGWMAPFSKLFGTVTAAQVESKAPEQPSGFDRIASHSPAANATVRQKPTRFVPKSGPALAASATTVNIEFSGTAVGRSVTSSTAVTTTATLKADAARSATPAPPAASRSLMGIFAGAPQPESEDPWVFVASKPGKKVRGQKSTMDIRTATLTKSAGRWNNNRLPRNVDAVVDSGSAIQDSDEDENGESAAIPDTLLERTLRPRGLSDSSIRTTFLNDGTAPISPTTNVPDAPAPTPISPVPIRTPLRSSSALRQSTLPVQGSLRTSVLQSFSRAFAIPSLSTAPANISSSPPTSSSPQKSTPGVPARSASPRGILPSFAGWAASQAGLDAQAADDFVGSVRDRDDEALFGRPPWHRESLGRDI